MVSVGLWRLNGLRSTGLLGSGGVCEGGNHEVVGRLSVSPLPSTFLPLPTGEGDVIKY